MAKPLHEPGVVVDDYRLEERVHSGGMATLWRVSRPGATMPLLMKVPRIGEGADPAAIVGFEMEQMILPRLTGVHVPKFVAAGDFAVQPYIVMEAIAGKTLLERLPELPLPYAEVVKIGVKTICTASMSCILTSSRVTSCSGRPAKLCCSITASRTMIVCLI